MQKEYKRLFATEDGLKVLEDIEITSGIEQTSFRSDPMEMAYCEGKKFLVRHIRNMMKEEVKQIREENEDA